MSYDILTSQGRIRPGLGRGARGRTKMILRKRGIKGTSKYISRFRSGYNRTGGFYGRFRGLEPELKFFDTALVFNFDTTAECSTSNLTGNVHIVPQDDTPSGREGRHISIKSLQMRGNITFVPGASATAASTAYLWLILDTQCNGANPAITDPFTTNVASTMLVNLANDKRFKIIKKWKWSMVSTAGVTTAYNNVTKTMNYYKKCNIPITYDQTATTGAITTTRQNSIFLAFGSDTLTDDLISYNGVCRIRYLG